MKKLPKVYILLILIISFVTSILITNLFFVSQYREEIYYARKYVHNHKSQNRCGEKLYTHMFYPDFSFIYDTCYWKFSFSQRFSPHYKTLSEEDIELTSDNYTLSFTIGPFVIGDIVPGELSSEHAYIKNNLVRDFPREDNGEHRKDYRYRYEFSYEGWRQEWGSDIKTKIIGLVPGYTKTTYHPDIYDEIWKDHQITKPKKLTAVFGIGLISNHKLTGKDNIPDKVIESLTY